MNVLAVGGPVQVLAWGYESQLTVVGWNSSVTGGQFDLIILTGIIEDGTIEGSRQQEWLDASVRPTLNLGGAIIQVAYDG